MSLTNLRTRNGPRGPHPRQGENGQRPRGAPRFDGVERLPERE